MNSLKEYIQERIEMYETILKDNPYDKPFIDLITRELEALLSKIEELENNK